MASLTLAEAEQILAAAKAKVLAMGVKMSISVVDPRRFNHHVPDGWRLLAHPADLPRQQVLPLWLAPVAT